MMIGIEMYGGRSKEFLSTGSTSRRNSRAARVLSFLLLLYVGDTCGHDYISSYCWAAIALLFQTNHQLSAHQSYKSNGEVVCEPITGDTVGRVEGYGSFFYK